jgi:glycosyltransferase involved in cell wall biosynthesis
MSGPADVLIVAIDSTGGWISAAQDLLGSLHRAGARAELVRTGPPPRVRTLALTDYTQARLARSAALAGIDAHQPRAIVYCSITAALLWPRPGAIFLDAMASENRRGRHGVWQRPVERKRLRQAPLLLPWSERSLDPVRGDHAPAVTLPPPVEIDDQPVSLEARDVAAVTYAGDPVKRRLEMVLSAWQRARRPGEELVVTGLDGTGELPEGVRSAGRLARPEFRDLLRRAKAFVAAPRREDHGIAALEALACGCRLVTTPSPGPYVALELARALDDRLVSDDLAGALRIALDDPAADYASRAAARLTGFTPAEVDRTVAEVVLPRLLAASTPEPSRP